jgi:hypothetical protein
MSLPSSGQAQQRKPLVIEQVQVGFGPSEPLAKFKAGFWTPVYVDLRAGSEREVPGGGKLIVESVDGDDVRGRYTVALPRMDPDDRLTVQTYTRAASSKTEITVTAILDGRVVATNQKDCVPLDLGQHLYLTLGSRQANAIVPALNPKEKQRPGTPDTADDEDFNRGDRKVTSLDDIRMLPNRWFGYDPVDLVVLTTGNRDGFLTALLNEREGRKEALAEWVRRGGRLVVSVGVNQDMVAKVDVLAAMLPVAITGNLQLPHLHRIETWARAQSGSPLQHARPRADPNAPVPPIDVAKLETKPGREVEDLVPEKDAPPLIVQGAYGLGSITVVAFDLDKPPFKGWRGEPDFWKKLIERTAPVFQPTSMTGRGNLPGSSAETPDVASQLETKLEEFEDVPVISFGWVALFILIYILVVGPLDYLFLKKVVKRLELTWITFPTVVITISVAAYFTAYWLKGNDQKINKVDLLDIDLQTQQVCGQSWFTIFSPRIQHYTVGLEPVEPGWAPAPGPGRPGASVLLTWMGRPDMGPGGVYRGQSQGLFRRAYDYTPEATGLVGVPIQVWSTKSFAATWQANLDPAAPLVTSDLGRVSNLSNDKLTGTITSRLPVRLEDVALYYKPYKKWYSLEGGLLPNVPQRVDAIQGQSSGQKTHEWVPTGQRTTPIIKRLMFFSDQGNLRDSALFRLDQTWRLEYKNEVIVFGRVARQEGLAEDITTNAASPTRLWLGALPAPGTARPALNGTLSQESFVRIIIPLKDKP